MGGTGARENEEKGAISGPADRRWSFGPAVLDERTLELVVNGEVVSVERKPLEVLLFLLNHAGEVVTKDEILEAVWPGRILTESVLTKCIAKIRDALHDENSELIKTQHGYGYRLVAKVNVEASSAPPPPRFDFKPGDHPPNRPNWNLIERLGAGGHGEVWLARHEKTREPRVFKFALDTAALASLKREITLYRVLHDALGGNTSIVEIHEWNLEQPPYFIEGEYVESGSLVTWAEAQEGLSKIPLEVRLDIAAQIAETLAAAHSVGVLHKDLKPSNVLIVSLPLPTDVGRGRAEGAGEGRVQIKLADFGSGGVLDPHRLEQMGITRLGFTKTVAATGTTSGTPIYLAPEVIAGQPFTVQADIYALGVVLYQLVIGSFKKSLAPGWELGIEDELLREDIASAAAGDLSRRLADAAELGRRLRTLDQRRTERAEERKARELVQQAKADAERAQQAMERMRVRRRWMVAVVLVLAGGVFSSFGLYLRAERARAEAVKAAETTKAVSDFLTKGMLVGGLGVEKEAARSLTLEQLAARAGAQVDGRFANRPDIAAEVHDSIASTYLALGMSAEAPKHFERALELARGDPRIDPVRLAEFKYHLVDGTSNTGRYKRNLELLREILPVIEDRFGKAFRPWGELDVWEVHLATADTLREAGQMGEALEKGKALVEDLTSSGSPSPVRLAYARMGHAYILGWSGYLRESEHATSSVLPEMERAFGADHLRVAITWWTRGMARTMAGNLAGAESDLLKASEIINRWVEPENAYVSTVETWLARLRIEQGRLAEAKPWITKWRSVFGWQEWVQALAAPVEEIDAELDARAGRVQAAYSKFRKFLDVYDRIYGPQHPWGVYTRAQLIDLLIRQGDIAGAEAEFAKIPAGSLSDLPGSNALVGVFRFAAGQLARRRGDSDRARAEFGEALRHFEDQLVKDHWRTRRVREELSQVPAPSR